MDVCIIEERSYASVIESTSESADFHTAHIKRKHFLYFTNEKIFSVLMAICRTLGMRTALFELKKFPCLHALVVHHRNV